MQKAPGSFSTEDGGGSDQLLGPDHRVSALPSGSSAMSKHITMEVMELPSTIYSDHDSSSDCDKDVPSEEFESIYERNLAYYIDLEQLCSPTATGAPHRSTPRLRSSKSAG
jgi:hypothetical protein